MILFLIEGYALIYRIPYYLFPFLLIIDYLKLRYLTNTSQAFFYLLFQCPLNGLILVTTTSYPHSRNGLSECNKPVSISFGALANSKEHRTQIVNRLVESKIETRIFSAGNLGLHPFWVRRYGKFDDEMSNIIHSRGFFVPNYPELTNEDIDYICSVIKGE